MHRRFALLLLLAFGFALVTASARQQDPPIKIQDPKQKPEAEPLPQEETITFDTNLVMVNVTITDDKDRYVGGLKREDFSLFGRTAERVPICLFRLGAIAPEKVAESARTGLPLASLHSSKFAPVPEPTIKTGVTAMTAAVLDLLTKK